ncbi:TetR/AcrR family transcriptional regulator [Streptococcus zalophi]|uniref:TetR/AcrR family transcriptional regulator n=1 Tax=Streptococcus zalophi TaxID=640031 RepID=UPI00215C7165|nr:TetR/AcrR family transcriptional regulator [Streptococcus zalophi]MCR8967850.1 TetR/AcrR family transcriptional regulator [Streptococcus zalophi]
MKKQPQVTEQTKKNLIKAFLLLNSTNEIQKVTVNDICKTAGYNRSTFYQYFSDIYSLRNYIENDLLQKLGSLFKSHLDKFLAEDYLDIFLDFYSDNSETFLILLGKNGDPFFTQKIKDTLKPIIYSMLSIDENVLEYKYVIEFTMSAMINTVTYWFENDKDISKNQLSKIQYNIISQGIIPLLKKEL